MFLIFDVWAGRNTLPCVLRADSAASSMQRRTSACLSFRASGTKNRKRGVTWLSSRNSASLLSARAMPHLHTGNTSLTSPIYGGKWLINPAEEKFWVIFNSMIIDHICSMMLIITNMSDQNMQGIYCAYEVLQANVQHCEC